MSPNSSVSVYESISGGKEVLEWFGKVPNFHDAEILDLHLKREGTSTLRIHAWNMTSKVRNGYFVSEKHAVVEFSFGQIVNLELDQFNHQNVINGLTLSQFKYRENWDVYEVSLEPSFGLGGVIQAVELSVSHHPGRPQ